MTLTLGGAILLYALARIISSMAPLINEKKEKKDNRLFDSFDY